MTRLLWLAASLSPVCSHPDTCFPTSPAVGMPTEHQVLFGVSLCLLTPRRAYLLGAFHSTCSVPMTSFSLVFTLPFEDHHFGGGAIPEKVAQPSQGSWFPQGPVSFDLFFKGVFKEFCCYHLLSSENACYNKHLAAGVNAAQVKHIRFPPM